jgi:glycine betaine/proline transport system ATP-binding protein
MRDGRVVQTGTAEDIITNPADDYVAEFVAGISRLKVVRAGAIMIPVAAYKKTGGIVPKDGPSVGPDENLTNIIRLSMTADAPVQVRADGKTLGIITPTTLLQTVIEGTETS